MSYTNAISDIIHDCLLELKTKCEASEDRTLYLMNQDLYECGEGDEYYDIIYQLPRSYNVGKWGYYEEYAIVSIRLNESNELLFFGKGVAENDDDYTFRTDELSSDNIVEITDLLNENN